MPNALFPNQGPRVYDAAMSDDVLKKLAGTIRARASASGDVSYTRRLLDGGAQGCARKLAEEAAEVVIAGVSQDDAALTGEAADLLYHLLVLLEAREVPLDDVLAELESRMGTSGLEEKAARSGKG
ncbi:phosphoribosyl-ATP pyrophosphatase [bacterium BMS3Bbin10]|nr:phosphoribosyl-ATP pyrophosphatase [bacterium BMS3Bbin10]